MNWGTKLVGVFTILLTFGRVLTCQEAFTCAQCVENGCKYVILHEGTKCVPMKLLWLNGVINVFNADDCRKVVENAAAQSVETEQRPAGKL